MTYDAPYYTIKVVPKNGDPVRVVTDKIKSFRFLDAERKTDTCTFTVDNFNLENFDDPLFRKGQHLEISWGYKGRSALTRKACIVKVSGFHILTVEARSISIIMNTEQKTRCFENMTDSQVVRKILNDDYPGIFAQRELFIQETNEVEEVITQAGKTDAQMFRRLAARNGYEFYVDHEGFHWKPRNLNQRPIRTYTWYGPNNNLGAILDYPTIENDITGKLVHVVTKSRNPETKKDVTVETGQDDEDILSLSEGADICDNYTKEDCKRLIESRVAKKQIRNTQSTSESRAKKENVARIKRSTHLTIKMTLTVLGDPFVYAKSVVQIFGMGKRLSNLYYVTDVEHVIDQSGYKTILKLKGDGHGGWAKRSKLAVGLSHIDNGDKKRNPKNNKRKQEDPGQSTEDTRLNPVTLSSDNYENSKKVTQYIQSNAVQQSVPESDVC